jgi:hypothetical protein
LATRFTAKSVSPLESRSFLGYSNKPRAVDHHLPSCSPSSPCHHASSKQTYGRGQCSRSGQVVAQYPRPVKTSNQPVKTPNLTRYQHLLHGQRTTPISVINGAIKMTTSIAKEWSIHKQLVADHLWAESNTRLCTVNTIQHQKERSTSVNSLIE